MISSLAFILYINQQFLYVCVCVSASVALVADTEVMKNTHFIKKGI